MKWLSLLACLLFGSIAGSLVGLLAGSWISVIAQVVGIGVFGMSNLRYGPPALEVFVGYGVLIGIIVGLIGGFCFWRNTKVYVLSHQRW